LNEKAKILPVKTDCKECENLTESGCSLIESFQRIYKGVAEFLKKN